MESKSVFVAVGVNSEAALHSLKFERIASESCGYLK